MKIWHDNSGEFDNASWYLKHIIVNDLQTNEKFYFSCEKWLAVEKDDGKIERELFVACEPQRTELNYLLKMQTRKSFRNLHLWFSIFNRPVYSSFTRVQRVTCGFVFLYLSMLLSILYYLENSTSNNFRKIDFVLFSITTEQVRRTRYLIEQMIKNMKRFVTNFQDIFF